MKKVLIVALALSLIGLTAWGALDKNDYKGGVYWTDRHGAVISGTTSAGAFTALTSITATTFLEATTYLTIGTYIDLNGYLDLDVNNDSYYALDIAQTGNGGGFKVDNDGTGNTILLVDGDVTRFQIADAGAFTLAGTTATVGFTTWVYTGATQITGDTTQTGSITATATITAEHLVSTDDADINDNLTVGNLTIDDAAGVISYTGATSATISTSTGTCDITLDSEDDAANSAKEYVNIQGAPPAHTSGTLVDIFLDFDPTLQTHSATSVSTNFIDMTFTTPEWDSGISNVRGIYAAPTIGDASAGTNTVAIFDIAAIAAGDDLVNLYGLRIGNLTGAAAVTENAVSIGTGWDDGLYSQSSVTIIEALTVGTSGAGHTVTFYGDTAGDEMVWDDTNRLLTVTGTHGAAALTVADGNFLVQSGSLTVGTDGDGYTSTWYSDTEGDSMVWSDTDVDLTITGTAGTTGLDVVDANVTFGADFTVHTDDFIVDADGNITIAPTLDIIMIPVGGDLLITGDTTQTGSITLTSADAIGLNISGTSTTHAISISAAQTGSGLHIGDTWKLGFSDGAINIGGDGTIAFGAVSDSIVIQRVDVSGSFDITDKYMIAKYQTFATSAASTGTTILMGDYTKLTVSHDITDAYGARGNVLMNGTLAANQICGVMGNAEITGAVTLAATGGAYGVYGSVDSSGSGASNRNVAAGYFTLRSNTIDLTGTQSCVVADMGGSGYADYGFLSHVGNNNTLAGMRVEVSDSAVLPIGLQFAVQTAGSITNEIELISGQFVSSSTAGVASAAGSAAVEYAAGAMKTVITVDATGANILTLDNKDDGTGVLLYTFPEGYVRVLGVTADLEATSSAGIFQANFPMALGTTAGTDGTATLTGTQDDLSVSQAVSFNGAQDVNCPPDAAANWDGTGGGITVYLNAAVAVANINAESTVEVTGTVTIHWMNLGDY